MEEFKFSETEEGYSSKISIFDPPKMDTSILDTECIRYYPKAAISEGAPLVFRVDPNTGSYIDGKNSTMTVEMRIHNITKNTKVSATDKVTLTNLPLNSVFSQIAVTLSGTEVNPDVGSMNAYKNYIEMLLLHDTDVKNSVGEQRGYFQDTTKGAGTTDPGLKAANPNAGLIARHSLTSKGQAVVFKGPMGVDVIDKLNKYLINGLNVYITFYQSSDAFRLLVPETVTDRFKVVIESMYLTVCYVKLRPEVLVRHSELLASGKNAMYSYPRTYMRSHVIPANVNSFSISQILSERIPSLLVLGFVNSEAFMGKSSKSPFDFEHFDVNYVSLQVGSHSVPDRPMEPDFAENKFSEEYDAFLKVTRGRGSSFTKKDFKEGNSLFCFGVQNHLDLNDGVFPVIRKANTRLEIRFKTNLSESVVAVMYMQTPGMFTVSEARRVAVEY